MIARRRAIAAAVLGGLLVLVLAAFSLGGGGDDEAPGAAASASGGDGEQAAEPEPQELPGGGRVLFPDKRIVAFYGAPQDEELGTLGIGAPSAMAKRLKKMTARYARQTRPALPAMELISTIATADAGPRDVYSSRLPDSTIRRYHKAARRAGAILILDVQPGRVDFFTEAVRLRKWLKEPDVSLALDPEWRIGDGEVPGKVIGSVDAREVNAVSAWLQMLIEKEKLPQKLLLIHQFTEDMIANKQQLKPRKDLAITFNVDGFGGRDIKTQKYVSFVRGRPKGAGFHDGFKVFFKEDTGVMSPQQVMRLPPAPDLVVYE